MSDDLRLTFECLHCHNCHVIMVTGAKKVSLVDYTKLSWWYIYRQKQRLLLISKHHMRRLELVS